jgi:hypothetical protein
MVSGIELSTIVWHPLHREKNFPVSACREIFLPVGRLLG